jgi:hypothetical protein
VGDCEAYIKCTMTRVCCRRRTNACLLADALHLATGPRAWRGRRVGIPGVPQFLPRRAEPGSRAALGEGHAGRGRPQASRGAAAAEAEVATGRRRACAAGVRVPGGGGRARDPGSPTRAGGCARAARPGELARSGRSAGGVPGDLRPGGTR